jgi:hypothetical protein
MSKKIVLSVLIALSFALVWVAPAVAKPPLCSCPFCATGNASCTLPDGSLTTCGPYFGSHCTGPGLAPRTAVTPAPQTCKDEVTLAALFSVPAEAPVPLR